ncbi:hypothetical protein [Alkaliphilus peptidifermentans]|uniref:Replication restart DNA helicase PriA n=1 Tax=Alkaliphilus peptidifermentans DSM 18978 TaxID=1120976 RepID=A0A1G5FXK3_9FIRM|nr:hypothetical protein [Alkaliphilus peptidifermentans]SCY43881.1 hypothetical protein SAMN03080606_01530 [Alkaliphilus peptidifermentans DSM 18978]
MATFTHKCPNCGGALEFNADTQSWKCEFCLSDFNNETIKSLEDSVISDNDSSIEEQLPKEDMEFNNKARMYSCTSCGAEIVTDDVTAATFCYYCHSPAILPGQLSGKYRPAKVLPFKFKRDSATTTFINWCKKKPLLSKDFTSASQLELLSGIYVPFWLFDCDIRGKMTAEGRNIRTWVSGNKKYTETKYYDVVRAGTACFGKIPADGSKKIDDQLMETLEPFDYSQMEDFSMSYLSGYLAEKYDKDQNDVYGRISDRVQKYTDKLLRDAIKGYSSVSVKNCNVDIYKSKATYVLLPAWIFTYDYKGKKYIFAMNGQTGKVAGSLPLSKARMAAYFSIISGSVFAILLLGGMLI